MQLLRQCRPDLHPDDPANSLRIYFSFKNIHINMQFSNVVRTRAAARAVPFMRAKFRSINDTVNILPIFTVLEQEILRFQKTLVFPTVSLLQIKNPRAHPYGDEGSHIVPTKKLTCNNSMIGLPQCSGNRRSFNNSIVSKFDKIPKKWAVVISRGHTESSARTLPACS